METSSNPLPVALFFLSPHTKTIELEYCSPTRSGIYVILIGVSMMRPGRFDEGLMVFGTYCSEKLSLREPLTDCIDCIALSFRTRKLLIIATDTWIEIEVESRDENHQYRGRSKNMWLVSESSNHIPHSTSSLHNYRRAVFRMMLSDGSAPVAVSSSQLRLRIDSQHHHGTCVVFELHKLNADESGLWTLFLTL